MISVHRDQLTGIRRPGKSAGADEGGNETAEPSTRSAPKKRRQRDALSETSPDGDAEKPPAKRIHHERSESTSKEAQERAARVQASADAIDAWLDPPQVPGQRPSISM
jgi:hypothetical protein